MSKLAPALPPAPGVRVVLLLQRAAEATIRTHRHMAEELLQTAEKLERLRREARERCADGHAAGCVCVVLASIDEPEKW